MDMAMHAVFADEALCANCLSFLDLVGERQPLRLEISRVCRLLASCREYRKGDQIVVAPLPPPLGWRSAKFKVDNPNVFVFLVRLAGDFHTTDSFRIGVAPAELPITSLDTTCGFWLSPKSGRYLGQHCSNKVAAILDQGAGGFRSSRGVQRGPRGKGPASTGGKGGRERHARIEREGALAGRLSSGSVWGCIFSDRVIEFLFAESDKEPIQSLGYTQYQSNAGTSGSDAIGWSRQSPPRLPPVSGGYFPSLLFEVKQCDEDMEVMYRMRGGRLHLWSRGGFQSPSGGQHPPKIEVLVAESPICLDAPRCIVGRTLVDVLGTSFVEKCTRDQFQEHPLGWQTLMNGAGRIELKLRKQRMFPYWESLPLEMADGDHFEVAVRVDGEWNNIDRFRLGVMQVMPGGGPRHRSKTRVVMDHRNRKMPESLRCGFAVDIKSGCWIRQDRGGDYQRYLDGLANGKGKGKGEGRNSRGLNNGSISIGHVWAMRYKAGLLQVFHGENASSVSLIGELQPSQPLPPLPPVSDAVQCATERDPWRMWACGLLDEMPDAPYDATSSNYRSDNYRSEDDYDDHSCEEDYRSDLELPLCHEGYVPILWVLRREAAWTREGKGGKCSRKKFAASLQVIPMPHIAYQ